MKKLIVLFILFCSLSIFPQTGKLVGKVTESITGKPLSGVNIIIKGTEKGAATIGEGEYAILRIPAGKYQVNFSCRGYEMKTVSDVQIIDGSAARLDIELNPVSFQHDNSNLIDPHDDLPDALEKEHLNAIPKNIRDQIKQIKPLNRETYNMVLNQTYYAIKAKNGDQPHNFHLKAVVQKIDYLRILELDVQSELLGAQYRNTSDASRKKELKSKLNTVLKDLFKARQEESRIKISLLEEDLTSIKKSLDKWIKEEDKLIQQRLKHLTE